MSLPTIEGLSRARQSSPVPKPVQPVSAKGREEAVKLTANFVNSAAVGVLITGGLGPLLAFANGSISPAIAFWQVSGASLICMLAAVALHFAARRYVKQELSK